MQVTNQHIVETSIAPETLLRLAADEALLSATPKIARPVR
jgi:hypothetical protein